MMIVAWNVTVRSPAGSHGYKMFAATARSAVREALRHAPLDVSAIYVTRAP
jgi:hypothetical protein